MVRIFGWDREAVGRLNGSIPIDKPLIQFMATRPAPSRPVLSDGRDVCYKIGDRVRLAGTDRARIRRDHMTPQMGPDGTRRN